LVFFFFSFLLYIALDVLNTVHFESISFRLRYRRREAKDTLKNLELVFLHDSDGPGASETVRFVLKAEIIALAAVFLDLSHDSVGLPDWDDDVLNPVRQLRELVSLRWRGSATQMFTSRGVFILCACNKGERAL
jgi:hypothetical protein